MRVLILPDAESVAAAAAEVIQTEIDRAAVPGPAVPANAGFTLGVSTGSTPLGVWRELVRRHDDEGLSFANTRAVTLYEYVGVPASAPESFRSVIREQLLDPVGIPEDRVVGLDGSAPDVAAEAARFETAIAAAGGVDLQVLGIGPNGHLGFNEPTSSLGSRTRAKTLPDSARAGYQSIFGSVDLVPFQVLTQGIATIMDARRLLLLGLGASRADAVRAAVEGAVSAFWPASALQLHPHVTVLVDEEAAAGLTHTDYYRAVAANDSRRVSGRRTP
ncbi:hypothetical protein B7R54_02585 [Subtercola boreus]|uniref:Glucosamine/galactosamine-6-phosphate isomerase domain-containing protein n=1 Tax=Subtercola boreus TaxID=120213 RepID=A0A3E0VFA3_9MICO|nr:glucosamine-6-phosphate deaminase [Subtercola boreus]RFA08233.1 hypothetical protein B7R54_02585 [Subtercola boreus]TQL54873.1 glucosamine-6-phosphate deaminase [Subtercola boreus]